MGGGVLVERDDTNLLTVLRPQVEHLGFPPHVVRDGFAHYAQSAVKHATAALISLLRCERGSLGLQEFPHTLAVTADVGVPGRIARLVEVLTDLELVEAAGEGRKHSLELGEVLGRCQSGSGMRCEFWKAAFRHRECRASQHAGWGLV